MSYQHPTTIPTFEAVYREEYQHELESCDKWIESVIEMTFNCFAS